MRHEPAVVSAGRVVSFALNPSVATGAFFLLLAFTFEAPGVRLAVGALAWAFATAVPLGVLLTLVYTGRVTDLEMRVRAERTPVYLWSAAGYALGAALLLAIRAAWPLWVIMALHVPNTAVLGVVNQKWKVSVHTTVLTGLWVAALFFFGAAALPWGVAVLVGGWGRWAAGAHAPVELVLGATLGGVMTAAELAAIFSVAGR